MAKETLHLTAILPVLFCYAFEGGAEGTVAEVTREVYLMGTRCTLTTFAPDRQAGLQQIETHLRILEETEQELSTWKDESALSRLNRQPLGTPFQAGTTLCRLFQDLVFWQQGTGATFDPALGSLVTVWGLREGGRYPPARELEDARKRSGLRYFRFEPSTCEIVREREATLDCGAFGKGEALDRIRDYSIRHGSGAWLADLGGQIMVYGIPPNAAFWPVHLAHPNVRDRSVLTLRLDSGSLSTSAGSERDLLVGGRRVGHILDPRTGFPAPFQGSVTVWHESGLVADILSTALYVMGPKEGLRWAESHNAAVLFLSSGDENGNVTIRASRAFSKRFAYRAASR